MIGNLLCSPSYLLQYMLRLSKDATVEAMKDALQRKTGVSPHNVSTV